MPVGTILLLLLAAVLYAPMMACYIDAPNGDAFGRGLALAYGSILAGVLWLVLARPNSLDQRLFRSSDAAEAPGILHKPPIASSGPSRMLASAPTQGVIWEVSAQ